MNDAMVNLAEEAAVFGISLSAEKAAQFDVLLALLLDWNERMNLTAVTDPTQIQIRHFLDSLSCALVTGDLNGQKLIDVGTGAGFPGLPLKILFPQLHLTLVESVKKKTRFLEAAVSELGFENVVISTERAESLGQSAAHREQYDWAVARAVAEMRILAEYLLPLCRVGGYMVAQKGESTAQELEAAHGALVTLGGELVGQTAVQLPHHDQMHYLVQIAKRANTPDKYPRRPGMPAKRPL